MLMLTALAVATSASLGFPRPSGQAACPCSSPSWCNPISRGPRPEVFAFHVTSNGASWPSYNWSLITTVAVFGSIEPELLCTAHENGARVVVGIDFANDQLTNATAVAAWVNYTSAMVAEQWLDGVNIDIEGNTANADAVTAATAEMAAALRAANPWTQITFDTAINPLPNQGGYNFTALAEICDFLVPMGYDMCWGASNAAANAPTGGLEAAFQYYGELGVPADKVVLGLPWYAYNFPCSNPPPPSIAPVNGTAAPQCTLGSWNNGGSWQRCYSDVVETLLPLSPGGAYAVDAATNTGVFSYQVNSTVWYQVWFDNPATLTSKYAIAAKAGARGIAFWYAGCVDYNSTAQVEAMWGAIAQGFLGGV
jgi:di-N-acetylchitobiase